MRETQPGPALPPKSPTARGSSRLLTPLLKRVRGAFTEEQLDHRALWYLATEGLAAWVRALEQALGDHLQDRHRARALLREACALLYRRRMAALPEPLSHQLLDAEPAAQRAFFAALYPGPVGRSIRWTLHELYPTRPSLSLRAKAWRQVLDLDSRTRWLEVSHHLGELAIVLTGLLPERGVTRSAGWLGDVCYDFGREVGELARALFDLPPGADSAIQTLRMGEFLFRVNPEHISQSDPSGQGGFIEGDACLWHSRPGWSQIHCGVLGRFQSGVSEVFGLRYSLTRTIPKNGGNLCRITLSPLARREGSPPPPLTLESSRGWQGPSHTLSRSEWKAMLESLALEHSGPAGFFGPQSLIWNGTREAAVLLGGGRAALMQLAHPAVAHAIRDHSAVHRDMLGRFVRTMSGAYGILFGSVDEALSISSRLFEKHRSIRGTLDDIPGHPPAPYHALSAEANFWVGATLIETAVVVLERTIQPFTNAQRDRIIEEMAPFWALFGIRPADCPTRWSQLQDYIHERVAVFALLVGDTAREQARLLFQAQSRLLQPAFDQVRLVVAEQLPGPLQDAFGMQLSPPERLLARGWMFAAERLTPHLPGRLRYIPQYHRAARRILRA